MHILCYIYIAHILYELYVDFQNKENHIIELIKL